MAFRRYQDLERLFERRYAVIRFVSRPSSRPLFTKWYADVSATLPSPLPPFSNVIEIDSQTFQTELRVVFENELMCTSFVRRILRTDFAKNGVNSMIYVDREYVESTLKSENLWKKARQHRDGTKNIEPFSVRAREQKENDNTVENTIDREEAKPVLSKRKSSEAVDMKKNQVTHWAPSPPPGVKGGFKRDSEDSYEEEEEEEDDIDDLENFLESAMKKKKVEESKENANLKAIQFVEKKILDTQSALQTRRAGLNRNKKTSDSKVKEMTKEIENLQKVSNTLRGAQKKFTKEEVAAMLIN